MNKIMNEVKQKQGRLMKRGICHPLLVHTHEAAMVSCRRGDL